jgi:hypothetical protein
MELMRSLRVAALLIACAALLGAQGLDTTATKDDWEEINFEFNSAILSDGYPSLLRLAELLHANPDYKVTLDGNTDSVGSVHYNEKLGQRRSDTVKAFLVKYGASPDQILVVTHGKRQPKVSNTSKEGRFMNRRVQLTVTDGQGKIVSAGGIGSAIKAMQAATGEPQRMCCEDILKRLDKLDDILAALRDLKAENDKLKEDVAGLKAAQAGVEKQVAEMPRAPQIAEIEKTAENVAEKAVEKAKPSRFSLLGINIGPSLTDVNNGVSRAGAGNITVNARGRYFAPFGREETMALQAEGEFLYYKDRQEGQFDIGLVNRWTHVQAGLFSSLKYANITGIGGAALGQAAFTADVLFSRGRIGVFGTKGYLNNRVIGRMPVTVGVDSGGQPILNYNLLNEYYLHIVDQIGGSAQIGVWNNAYIEGNFGALFRQGGDSRPGGMVRLVQPISERFAATFEAGLNETMVGPKNTGRIAVGVQFGNWVKPKDFMTVKHPVPVDIPRLRYEVLSRQVRVGHTPPVADAGADQKDVAAGTITLDASASRSPEGLALTFQWVQIGGPSVQLASPTSAITTFTAAAGQTYTFRVDVKDSLGGQDSAKTTVSAKATPTAQIASFTATPPTISAGQTTTLAWQVQNADTVEISGIGPVNAQAGTANVAPTQTTTYTLTATNAQGSVNQVVTVTVNAVDVRILFFQASPASIAAGQSSVLGWQTQNADTVTLVGTGTVALNGSSSVSPTQTTTYTLIAAHGDTQVTATVTVTVVPPAGVLPTVIFWAPVSNMRPGAHIVLQWQTQNADSVSISGIGSVPASGTQVISPTVTTTYTLTATNANGQTVRSVTINVDPAASSIVSFTANPSSISAGQTVTLAWSTQDATWASIDGIGAVTPNGTLDVSPMVTTTYTLHAGGNGPSVSQQVTVTVTP